MKRGILVYNHNEMEWRVWVGQQAYWIDPIGLIKDTISNLEFKIDILKQFLKKIGSGL